MARRRAACSAAWHGAVQRSMTCCSTVSMTWRSPAQHDMAQPSAACTACAAHRHGLHHWVHWIGCHHHACTTNWSEGMVEIWHAVKREQLACGSPSQPLAARHCLQTSQPKRGIPSCTLCTWEGARHGSWRAARHALHPRHARHAAAVGRLCTAVGARCCCRAIRGRGTRHAWLHALALHMSHGLLLHLWGKQVCSAGGAAGVSRAS